MNATSKPVRLALKAVIFDEQNRCLVLRRSNVNRHFVGLWEWPGGKPEPGEDFSVSLAREVHEECGLEVELTGLAGASEFAMPAAQVVLLCLTARVTGGTVQLSDEHDAFEWVPLEALAERDMLEAMKPVWKFLVERKESHG